MQQVPVVFIHGIGSSYAGGWKRFGWEKGLLDQGRTVVGIDLLGHGTSAKPHDPGAYADLLDHARRQLPQTVADAVGFSFGAVILLRLAVAEP